jgi:hypothetical protein
MGGGLPVRRFAWGGFTLIEMLTTVAALVIVLGLMVSLARYVRHRSAEALTRGLLGKLDRLVGQHAEAQELLWKKAPALISGASASIDDVELLKAARANNEAFVQVWVSEVGGRELESLPVSLYDRKTVRDAWGTPVVLMCPGARNMLIAPQKRYFFLSAGPDRRFSTMADNLYSYERAWEP